MGVEKRIDSLIEAGWFVLESGFDPSAFANWRVEAFRCVNSLMGSDHHYTEYFKAFVVEPEPTDLLAGEGILVAIREQVPPGQNPQADYRQGPCLEQMRKEQGLSSGPAEFVTSG